MHVLHLVTFKQFCALLQPHPQVLFERLGKRFIAVSVALGSSDDDSVLVDRLRFERWYVRIEAAYPQAGSVLKYVGRYIRRGPLSERRILSYDGQHVRIAYAHPEKHVQNSFTLTAPDFVRRLLSHAPERGTHCVRVYGLYHSACRNKLNRARQLLSQPPYELEAEPPDTHELLHRMNPDFTGDLCPKCQARLVTVKVFRPGRSPPLERYVA